MAGGPGGGSCAAPPEDDTAVVGVASTSIPESSLPLKGPWPRGSQRATGAHEPSSREHKKRGGGRGGNHRSSPAGSLRPGACEGSKLGTASDESESESEREKGKTGDMEGKPSQERAGGIKWGKVKLTGAVR